MHGGLTHIIVFLLIVKLAAARDGCLSRGRRAAAVLFLIVCEQSWSVSHARHDVDAAMSRGAHYMV